MISNMCTLPAKQKAFSVFSTLPKTNNGSLFISAYTYTLSLKERNKNKGFSDDKAFE